MAFIFTLKFSRKNFDSLREVRKPWAETMSRPRGATARADIVWLESCVHEDAREVKQKEKVPEGNKLPSSQAGPGRASFSFSEGGTMRSMCVGGLTTHTRADWVVAAWNHTKPHISGRTANFSLVLSRRSLTGHLHPPVFIFLLLVQN